MTITLLLLLAAFLCCIAEALGKCPSWVVEILVILALLVKLLPA